METVEEFSKRVCEECGNVFSVLEVWICNCGKVLCENCLRSEPHCYHNDPREKDPA